LAVVSRIAQVASASLSVEELMQVVYEAVAPFFEHESYSVMQYLRGQDSLRMLFGRAAGHRIDDFEMPLAGFSSVVVREDRSLYIPDVSDRDRSLPDPLVVGKEDTVASWLGVPLRMRGQVVGVLSLAAAPKDAYGAEDERLLTIVADLLAMAIENVRLFDETRGQAERFGLLNRVSRAVSRTLDPQELIEALYDEISSTFDHDQFLVVLHQEATNELELFFGMMNGSRLPRERNPFGGLSGIVITERRTLHIRNFADEKDRLPIPYTAEGETSMPASWLGVPLMVGDRVLGALCIMLDRPHAYDADKVRLFEILADQIAFAMQNAETFQSMQAAAERLAIVNRIGRVVGRERDLERLGLIVHREIAPVFEADTFFIAMLNEDEGVVEFPFMVDEGERTPSDPIPLGDGLTSTVIRTKKPLHVRSAEEYGEAIGDPSLFGSMKAPESWLGIPLLVEGRVIGVINVQSYRPRAYSEDQALLLATIADQIAMSFENARLFRAAQQELEERTRAEEALRVSEERFALAVQGANEGIWDWNIQDDSLYWSPRFKEMLGYADDELEASFDLLKTILHPDDKAPTDAAIEAHLKDRTPYDVEQRLLTKSGDYIWVYARGQAVWDEEGLPTRMVGSSSDITELKKAEARLEEERTLLRTIIDNIPDFIYAKDREGRFVVAGSAIARFFGLESPAELLGKTIGDLLPEQDAADYMAEDRGIVDSREPVLNVEENVVDRSTGKARWLLVSKLPLVDAHDKTIGIVGIDRDITARKRAEQEVKRYLAEVEVANEEVKQFAYIVSHDLRAPLVNLKGFSAELHDAMELLAPHLERLIEGAEGAGKDSLSAAVEQDIPEALGFIETSVSRMDGFINSVLKLSRLGRRELALHPVDAAEYVETCRQSLAHQLDERGVELIVGDLPQVVADPTALEQIIGNLLTNAVNYLNPERPGRIEIGGEQTNLGARFWVKDNGRGIAKEDEEKVFAPFRRAGRQDVVGEGMGLSYVRTMVRQHGGQIWFESEPDVGTTFFFTIGNPRREGIPDGQPE